MRERKLLKLLPIIGFLISLGFFASTLKTLLVESPSLSKRYFNVEGKGRLVELEPTAKGYKLLLEQLTLNIPQPSPTRLYLYVLKKQMNFSLKPGDRVLFKANLQPMSGPLLPGGFDFKRKAFFEKIGGSGFAKKPLTLLSKKDLYPLAHLRQKISQILHNHLPGETGHIAAALIVGEKAGISFKTRRQFADAGIAHILAISGLHMTLVTGLLFFIIRHGFALIPSIALRYPIKKWAAVIALLGGGLYLALSGFGIPAKRSFLMLSLVMIAILYDRTALSMRTLALAAVFLLLIQPESLTFPGFQLSFAAVMALIAGYEALSEWRARTSLSFNNYVAYFLSIFFTSFIATLATTPYTIYHFNRFTLQALVANLIAVPLVGLWIMPCAVLALFLMPLQKEGLVLKGMAYGIETMQNLAETIASWPGAAVLVPSATPLFLGLVTLGGLWLCLWRQKWRLYGLFPIACGFLSLGLHPEIPEGLVDPEAKVIALKGEEVLWFSSKKASRFLKDYYLQKTGKERENYFPYEGFSQDHRVECKKGLCVVSLPCGKIQVIHKRDIRGAYSKLAFIKIEGPLPLLLDKEALANAKGLSFFCIDNCLRFEEGRLVQGERPWT